MKKLLSIIILCLVCLSGLEAQNYWEFIDHVGTFLGASPSGSLFSLDGPGGIARSEDGSAWPIVIGPETGFNYTFNSHCFSVSPEGRIFLFNDGLNAVMFSDDNGDTWQQMPQVSSCALTNVVGLYATNNETVVGWAPNGEIFWTTDTGETWGYSILSFLENSESVSDLLVNENGDVYVSVAYYIMNIVGVYHATLSDMQNWELVAFEGIDIKEMAFDPEGNVVACGYNVDGSSVGFQHVPGFYLFDGTTLAISDSGIVYTPHFMGVQAVLSYSTDHGEHFTEIGEHLPLVDIAPGGDASFLIKGYDNYLYFDSGGEYWKSVYNADEIPTVNTLIGTKFFDEVSALYYIITSDTTVEVTYDKWHFNTYVGDIVVPSTVNYEGNTYTVTAIGEIAFGGCEGQLNSVIVPNTVKIVCQSAFASSPRLSLVVLPNSIDSIGPRAFSNSSGLTTLRLPERITTLSEGMFYNCAGLTTLEIPSSVTRIEKEAFYQSGIRTIDIPDSVTYIGESAFESCTRLTSIDIPNSVTEIGPSAFYFCQALQSAHLPETLEVIPKSLFERCVSLSAIDIPATVTEIGKSAFCYTTAVTEMVIPDAVQIIGDEAFLGCSRLSSITLPSHLGSINVGLFQDCTALHSITIPQSVVAISRSAFKQSGLVSITFEGDIDDIGGYAFGGCTSLRSIVLPTTAHIEDAAFYGCSNLETVVITGRVYEIRSYAFGECTALQTVTLLQSIPPLDGGNVFAYCNNTIRLIVPCGAKEAYENSDWGNENVNIEEDCGDLTGFCEAPFNFGGSPTAEQGIYGAQLWWNKPFASHWFHYDDKPYEGAVYCNYWGIRIPAEEIQAGDVLTHVAFYKAGGQDQTMGYSFAFSFEGETEPDSWDYLPGNWVQVEPGPDGWLMVKLGSPIVCEEGKCLWIILTAPNVEGNNAPYCQASGNSNACWSSEGSAPGDWMIRGYFTNDVGYNDPDYNEDLDHYNIYRGSSLDELEKIAEVGRDEEEYFDTLQQPFGDYYYQLTAAYTDGRESVPAKRSENPHSPDYVYFHVGNMSSLGSEWYYEIQNEDGSTTYQHLEYAADTTVNHKDVKIIIRTNTLYDKGEHNVVTREYIYEDFGKVYWWNETLQDFTMLYDLGAQIGDEWVIRVGTESILMHVDTVEQYEYEGTTYRMLHVSDTEDLFSGEILSGIGHLSSFFPERLMARGKAYRVEGIRCYWREGQLVFKYGEEDCDAIYKDYHFGLDDQEETVFAIYPNPTHSVLFVETHDRASQLSNQTYRITNLTGQTVLVGNITAETQQIDVINLPAGMYFITLGGETIKFVVR